MASEVTWSGFEALAPSRKRASCRVLEAKFWYTREYRGTFSERPSEFDVLYWLIDQGVCAIYSAVHGENRLGLSGRWNTADNQLNFYEWRTSNFVFSAKIFTSPQLRARDWCKRNHMTIVLWSKERPVPQEVRIRWQNVNDLLALTRHVFGLVDLHYK